MKQKQKGTHDAAAVLHEILGVNLGHQVAQEIGLHHHQLGNKLAAAASNFSASSPLAPYLHQSLQKYSERGV